MARIAKNKKLQPSLLERLIDDEPASQSEVDPGRQHHLRQLRDGVRRDLENLLNTRCHIISPPDDSNEVGTSLLNYGLPDLATVNIVDAKRRQDFIARLEHALRTFEPRFKSVKVSYLDAPETGDRAIHFRIDAVLYAEPQPEVIVFDSMLESVTRSVSVKEI